MNASPEHLPRTGILAPTIITAHINADFDALAGIVAASKLYPDAVLIFPGSQDKQIRNFFVETALYLFKFKQFKQIDPASVQKLVVVDTRQKSRIEHVAPVLENPDLRVEVYDHHPPSADDLNADFCVVKPWGSVTAILIDILRQKNMTLSPDEATLLGLGLYEDTGNFTFPATTRHDLEGAAWLLEMGMDLNVIADITAQELSYDQVRILNTLIEGATRHTIHNIEIVIVETTLPHYVQDFALLAHKLMDMDNMPVLFALGHLHDRVQIVARSRTPKINVGQICTSFGGGGHAHAASASVKDRTLTQVKDELFALLYSHTNPQLLVRNLMSTPPITIDSHQSLQQAAEITGRYGLKAAPVVHLRTNCIGIIEHEIADKAVKHGLGQMPVSEYMFRDVTLIGPQDDLYAVVEIILGQRQRLLPVVEQEKLIGVITRTDLINILVEQPSRIPKSLFPDSKKEKNIARLVRSRLPEEILNLLYAAGELGQETGCQVYCVGGFVRDLILNQPNSDLDLVVESDGIEFARKLARKLGGRISPHSKFKTAVIVLPNGQKIDVATARLEYYEYPAALPVVELSSIKMDLFRRDFTINALAVHLNPQHFGQLVDFFGGQRDLKEGTIRVLHSLSFVEDPTRIIRAVRFAQRFNFRLGGQTERLIKNANMLGLMPKLSKGRIFQELRIITEENRPVACFQSMQKLGLLKAIHPWLALTPEKEKILLQIDTVINWYRLLYLPETPCCWILYFLGLFSGLKEQQYKELTKVLGMKERDKTIFLEHRMSLDRVTHQLLRQAHGKLKNSELYSILRPSTLETVLYIMARSQKESLKKSVSTYLIRLQHERIDINGRDLIAMNIAPGPVYGRILERILQEKLDDRLHSREEQLARASQLARRAQQFPAKKTGEKK